jgi:hypothetical protein
MRPYCKYIGSDCDAWVATICAPCTGCRLEAAWANLALGLALAGLCDDLVRAGAVTVMLGEAAGLSSFEIPAAREENTRQRLAERAGIPLAAGGR